MPIPSRPAQIKRIAEFLEESVDEGRTVDAVAKKIVDGIYDMWTRSESSPPIVLKVGLAFKAPMVSKVYHVGWIGDMWWSPKLGTISVAWIIDSGCDYGSLMPVDRPMWRIVTPSTAKSGAAGNNKDGWKPGDRVSSFQRSYFYEILAVGDKCVLMANPEAPTMIYAESNVALKKYYNKERE